MNAHTPGPWVVTPKKTWSASIAVMAASKIGVPVGWASRVARGGDEEALANARLIAAAPLLLDLLQKHLDWFDGKFLPIDEGSFIEATRAAIAKARGK